MVSDFDLANLKWTDSRVKHKKKRPELASGPLPPARNGPGKANIAFARRLTLRLGRNRSGGILGGVRGLCGGVRDCGIPASDKKSGGKGRHGDGNKSNKSQHGRPEPW